MGVHCTHRHGSAAIVAALLAMVLAVGACAPAAEPVVDTAIAGVGGQAPPSSTPIAAPPEGTATPAPSEQTPTPTPTPTPAPSPAGLGVAAVEAEAGANAVRVRFTDIVHIRGRVWLETSQGPSAVAAFGGSPWLEFGAGKLAGDVEIRGISMASDAAIRDAAGVDAATAIEPTPWRAGAATPSWDSGDGAPPEVIGVTALGRHWIITFTNPVYVAGPLCLQTTQGCEQPIDPPVQQSPMRQLRFEGAPDPIIRHPRVVIGPLRSLGFRASVRMVSGGPADVAFDPVEWRGYPRQLTPTVADCAFDAGNDRTLAAERLTAIRAAEPALLTDAERYSWNVFFERTAPELRQTCQDLWSEAITADTAAKRNDELHGETCKGNLRALRRVADIADLAFWGDVIALMERRYLSLTPVERLVLREHLGEVAGCRDYYPQLFTGRWIPLPPPSPTGLAP